jgi:2-polyprenyl-3-methyl-5-hydroxy-6-metoxy-1,4-benzoquinol methylase
MIINYIVKKCWCNEVKTKEFFNGLWYANNKKFSTRLGRCIKCGTIRTLVANNDSQVEYDDTSIYSILSYRHNASLNTILKYIKTGTLLEVGCSTGLVLQEVKKHRSDINVLGIDLNQNALKNSVDSELDLRYLEIDELNSKFNNIISMHVIEHIPDLKSFFENIASLGERNTIIYFSLPNINSFNFLRAKNYWGALNPQEHTWHFSKKTFKKVVKNFLPNSKVLCCKTSWVWKPSLIGFLCNKLIEGDQIEIVVKL